MIISLDEPLQCEQLCKIIQRAIARWERENGPAVTKALSIKIVDIEESTAHIPKLEHQNEDNNPA